MLRTVPLQSLLDWLSKPEGPNLVEASVAVAPEKALVLAVTKKMLYVEEPPLVGVGLVYKLHYVSMVQFSVTYVLFPSGDSGSILSGPSNPDGGWLIISLSLIS